MIIGIDLDDTICDLNGAWMKRINEHLGTNYQREDWKDWDASFLHTHGIKDSTIFLSGDIYEEVTPIEAAIASIREFKKISGVHLKCVTANVLNREEEFTKAKLKWLQRHFPEMLDNIQFSRVKKGIGLNILVDDGPHHFHEPDFKGVLVKQPWNHHISVDHTIHDWKDAPEIMKNVLLELGHKDLKKIHFQPYLNRKIKGTYKNGNTMVGAMVGTTGKPTGTPTGKPIVEAKKKISRKVLKENQEISI